MADEVKNNESKENNIPESIPYEKFKLVNDKAKAFEEKANRIELELQALKSEQEKAKRLADETKAKDEGDYKTLIQKITEEREAEKKEVEAKRIKMYQKAADVVMQSIAAKNGLIKPEYLNLFEDEVQLDDDTLEITNYEELEKSFAKFKKDNPTLFKEVKPVPKTDNKPQTKVNVNDESVTPIDTRSKLLMGAQELLKGKK